MCLTHIDIHGMRAGLSASQHIWNYSSSLPASSREAVVSPCGPCMCDLFQEVVLMLTLTSDLPLCGETDGAIIKPYIILNVALYHQYLETTGWLLTARETKAHRIGTTISGLYDAFYSSYKSDFYVKLSGWLNSTKLNEGDVFRSRKKKLFWQVMERVNDQWKNYF